MPPPIKVHLFGHDPLWATMARDEGAALAEAIGPNLIEVHHIGSTAIPDIKAKPIIDLMPVVQDISLLESVREQIERLGYEWLGEYGLQGRRYLYKDDPITQSCIHCLRDDVRYSAGYSCSC